MSRQELIMNFAAPPSITDLEVICKSILEVFPEELMEFCESLTLEIEDFADEAVQEECDTDDPYEILCFFRSGKQLSPGVESKTAGRDDTLTIFRRPVLDLWCETCDDLNTLIRQVMIEEVAQQFDFEDDEIEEMISRHHQGML